MLALSSAAFSVLSFQHFDVVHDLFKVVLSVFSQQSSPEHRRNLSLRVDEVLPENYLAFRIHYVPFFINQVPLLIAATALVIEETAFGVSAEHGKATWISLEISLNAVDVELHEGENLRDLFVLGESVTLKEDLAVFVDDVAFIVYKVTLFVDPPSLSINKLTALVFPEHDLAVSIFFHVAHAV